MTPPPVTPTKRYTSSPTPHTAVPSSLRPSTPLPTRSVSLPSSSASSSTTLTRPSFFLVAPDDSNLLHYPRASFRLYHSSRFTPRPSRHPTPYYLPTPFPTLPLFTSPLHVSPRPVLHPSITLQSTAASSLVAAAERNFFGPAYYSPFPPTSTSDPLLYALTLYETTPADTLTSRLRHLELQSPPLLSTTTYPYDFPSSPLVTYFYARLIVLLVHFLLLFTYLHGLFLILRSHASSSYL